MVHFEETKQKQKLSEMRRVEEERLAQELSRRYGVPYMDLSRTPINTDALRIVPESRAREGNLAVFNSAGSNISIALLSPKNEKTKNIIDGLAERGYSPSLYLVSLSGLERAWRRYGEVVEATETHEGVFTISFEAIKKLRSKIKTVNDHSEAIQKFIGSVKSGRTTRLLETVLAGGFSLNASDIHLEPGEKNALVRLRLNGILVNVTEIPTKMYKFLLARIKLLSGLKLNIRTSAQDGRFSVKIDTEDIEIRTSILPEKDNESVVMRILNPSQIAISMESLGFEENLLMVVEREINKPNGMIFTTGPTGSGKTTTLYAFLKKVHKPEIKIITIEDPIEYRLDGIVQTQTRKKYGFSEGLRAALRQDPDVIMVGEVRDTETATTAINAALTGHLVFSTLHTNNAAGTFPRLIDLGVNPKVISSAVNIAIAQRLVRVLCEKCKKERQLTDNEAGLVSALAPRFEKAGIKPPQTGVVFTAGECDACGRTGYSGRIGIFEAIVVDGAVDEIVRQNPSEGEIKKAAAPQNILDMREDGVLKALKGITSFEELRRVVELY